MGNSPFWQPATIVMYCVILLFYLWLLPLTLGIVFDNDEGDEEQ